jgi:hypothetical protein
MSEQEIINMIRSIEDRLRKLENLPNSIDRLADAIDSHTKVFASAVPLPVVKWTFGIVVLLIGGAVSAKEILNILH